jgi:hypothetical protein
MTTGAERVIALTTDGRARAAARAGIGAGVAGALANMLLLAFAVLAVVRPGPVQATFWPLACVAAGASAALLIPVALVLGGASVVSLGVASMAFSAAAWLLLATGLLAPATGAPLLAGCGLGFATWLFLVCRRGTEIVPPRAGRVGRRAAVAALAGTVAVAVGSAVLPTSSTAWLAVLLLGGIPAVLGWLAVPAWTLRVAGWLRTTTP